MKILTIVPARKNSKRLPGKNTKMFCGSPLVSHTIAVANSISDLSTVVVSSDDKMVLDIAASYDKITPLTRPEHLADDESLAIEYVKHTLDHFTQDSFDVVLILQATSPFTCKEDVMACIDLYSNNEAESVVSVAQVPFDYHPMKFKTVDKENHLYSYFGKEGAMEYQNLPKVYTRNGSIYMTSVAFIRKYNKILSDNCMGHIMPALRSVDINDEIDFAFAEFLNEKYGFLK